MRVKDFLEKFNGSNHIKIFDKSTFSTRRYNNVKKAINDYDRFMVEHWTIEDNVLIISIKTQF